MSWNYDPTDLSTSVKDYVRWLIGDTDSTNPELQDEEISNSITVQGGGFGNAYAAAMQCAEALLARYTRRAVNKKVGDLSIDYSKLIASYQALVASLRLRVTLEQAPAYAGGQSFSDKLIDQSNSDQVQPNFAIGMHDRVTPVPDVGPQVFDPFDQQD